MTEPKVSKPEPDQDTNLADWGAIWKDIYFKTESSFGEAWKKFLETDSFMSALNKTMADYLASSRAARQRFEAMSEFVNYASRQDVARLAELILSLEEKQDTFEDIFNGKMDMMADNLLKMTEIFKTLEQQQLALAAETQKAVADALGKLANAKPAPRKTAAKTAASRATVSRTTASASEASAQKTAVRDPKKE